MKFIKCPDERLGQSALTHRLILDLSGDKKVLWLIPGGSNIPIAAAVMETLRTSKIKDKLSNLTVMLTDERYGNVGHPDSNWQQLMEHKFSIEGITAIPVLLGLDAEETTFKFGENFEEQADKADVIIGQFGIGADAHIAGILPNSPAVRESESEKPSCLYEAGKFTRITLTYSSLKRIDCAFAFVFGDSKKEAVHKLQELPLSLEEIPSSILQLIPEAYLYSDQVEN